jgi:hypothetical protein
VIILNKWLTNARFGVPIGVPGLKKESAGITMDARTQ